MGTRIEFKTADGTSGSGYLAGDEGPGVIVIQEWWGVVPQIEATCDRFAVAGFTALAPDLYGGRTVPLDEPDEAAKAMMSLEIPAAARELAGAVDALLDRTGHPSVGTVGYCMGGGLALLLGAERPDAVQAVVPCYGVHPWAEGQSDYSTLLAAVQIHCAALDDYFTPDAAVALETTLRKQGRDVELFIYEGAAHAFANEERPEVHDAAAAALMFNRTVAFLASHLK